VTTTGDLLTIGEVARRAGVSVATLRYYEQRGLVVATRTSGNQRRYPRWVLRRLAFVAAAQRVGLNLDQVKAALDSLPSDRAPTQQDWTRLAQPWRQQVADRLRELQALQDTLDGCLGCGCLSLTRCALFNADDEAAAEGDGSRWLRDASRPGL
jgi:MerR family redox-sensitive transcriptional activator SoxR